MTTAAPCIPGGEVCTTSSQCCDGIPCTNGRCVLPSSCNQPINSVNPTDPGGGTASTTQCQTTPETCVQTFQVSLSGATPGNSCDVYLDQDSFGDASSHKFAGTSTIETDGTAFFQNTITVAGTCPTVIDNEITPGAGGTGDFTDHRYIQDSFVPCNSCPT